jgi:hypothetical protein
LLGVACELTWSAVPAIRDNAATTARCLAVNFMSSPSFPDHVGLSTLICASNLG